MWDMASVGFIGLGVMGGGIAGRLLAAGHDVHGWNRTRSKAAPLEERGLVWCDTPREVAERSDVVFTMVTNVGALDAVLDGDDGLLAGLGPGKVYVDMSTVSPAASRRGRGASPRARAPRCWTRRCRAASRRSRRGSSR